MRYDVSLHYAIRVMLNIIPHTSYLFLCFCLTGLELFNTASSVDSLFLIGIERVRSAGDFELIDRIFLTVSPLCCFCGLDSRRNEKTAIAGVVSEDYGAVVMWVDILFHSA
jgi:hypothetical protein